MYLVRFDDTPLMLAFNIANLFFIFVKSGAESKTCLNMDIYLLRYCHHLDPHPG